MEVLHTDIRAVLLVQCPPYIDMVCALALLQGEVVDGVTIEQSWSSISRLAETVHRAGVAMPLPPPSPPGQPPAPTSVMDRRSIDAARADGFKLKALWEYRRATSASSVESSG